MATLMTNQAARGTGVAELLSGSWRKSPLPFANIQGIEGIQRVIFHSGCAGLAWWRVRETPVADTELGQQFHAAYRRYRLSARVHENEIANIFARLRDAGIEPVLVKGWAIARRYPDPGLRPYGDIDICVRPDQYEDAQAALKYFESVDGHYVDLHQGIDSVGRGNVEKRLRIANRELRSGKRRRKTDGSGVTGRRSPVSRWHEIFARTQLVPLNDIHVRVLSDEDHLRVLCHHFLLSGAWRPLSLVDIAVMIENANCESRIAKPEQAVRAKRDENWTNAVVALAQDLLGANPQFGIRDSQFAIRNLPAWLKPAVLRQWGRCQNPSTQRGTLPTLMKLRSQPREMFREIYARWDHPIRSTAALEGRFNTWPRAPYQVIDHLMRMRAELPKQLRIVFREFSSQRRNMYPSTVIGRPSSI